ncbi:glutamic-type intramembrane protease PrsW [Paenibacillus sacheonensis]|uniref:Protease PrsW n=1 Tax=Paenibacillus sacheonensis TaxID=742054 RepID=A0A7X4YMC2_9BACL|nr:glutamic-type intramembrane protease PrsW [Paenibacillus sacheonensis]MBM7564461.1 RsiW-degrading membrane proteinase PrsW (M82 family) [Paenibacillus sacheonensis]NBC69022.1 intramembrane metalloprotease PrsW [Paenibacillus sacheonensis]
MLLFSIITAAVAPGVALLTYFYLKDRYEAEPIHMVLRVFLMGVLIVLPIMVIQRGLELWLGNGPVVFSFAVSAGAEELVKWFVIYHIIYKHKEFNEPYDGIVYAAAISLGFATVENVLYAVYQPMTVGSLLIRALLPVSGHALFGVTMGYYLGKAKFASAQKAKRRFLILAAAVPLLEHGLYDYIMGSGSTYWAWFIVPLMVYLWFKGVRRINRANARSPFRLIGREEEIKL